MDTSLRVLLVAASQDDAEPLLEELRRGGHEVTWKLVSTRAEMEQAVSGGKWDVVLSEYDLPGFGALAALEVASKAGLEAPFLVVSDDIAEDSGVRVLRAGADNCLPRSALPSLAAEVERKVSAARLRRERRQARRALRESESRFRAIAESASDAILTTDADGIVLFANRAAERVFGHPVAALIGWPVERLLPGFPRPTADGGVSPRGTSAGERPPVEWSALHASGKTV